MATNQYRFLTAWDVPAPRAEVFAVITDSKSLTRWWPSVYRSVEQISPPTRPDGVGKRLGLHTQGWLPYRLRWQIRVTEHETPVQLAFDATGDFVGRGAWTLHDRGDATRVEFEWVVRADKPLLERLSFLLRPVFALNHRWAMARGRESLLLELERRRGKAVAPPPPPVSALRSGFAIAALLVAALLGAAAVRKEADQPTLAMPEEALVESFASATRNLVIRWDPADPRSADERTRSLYAFMYDTYDASAWIPQSLFDGNAVTQAITGDVETIVGESVGLVLWRDNPLVPAFGMAPNAGADGPLMWTVNCVICHTAEIDGVAYFGAGTKTFDDLWLGEALKRLTSERWLSRLDGADRAVAADAHRILDSHHHDKIDALTRARSTAFAASHVELFLRTNGNRMPSVEDVGRGDVKTPPLWHTAAKIPVSRWYSDGSFHGEYPLMASSMELEKDRAFDDLVEIVIPRIKDQFDSVLRYLRPPPYPYEIDLALAARGRALFESVEMGCAGCHGVYDGRGGVEWPGVHADVGTDPARRELVSEQFVQAFDRSPLAGDGRLLRSPGYAATPLTGVWANYPYLHNGSVPTLHHLLGPVSERPRIFEVMAARTLDRERIGQPLFRRPEDGQASEDELLRRHGNDRDWFVTDRVGSSNAGHDVWPRVRTDANRRALVEYLKTL